MDSIRIRRALWALAWGSGPWLLSRIPIAVDLVPALGVLRGPLGSVLLGGGGLVAVGQWLSGRLAPPEPRGATLGLVAAAVYLALGLTYTERLRVSGDEPHYLVMAQSLWREADLDLRDNYAREDYREYTPGPVDPHFGAPRRDGRPYPAHSPGLPVVLAPLYAAGGRAACVIFLALAATALTVVGRQLALSVSGDLPAALAAWVGVLGPPVVFYAFHVYTEVPAALATSGALALLLSSPSRAGAIAAALLASALPWLHVKMIPAAVALGLVGLWRLSGGARTAFAAVAGAAAGLFALYYLWIFGQATPLAIYGGVPGDLSVSPLHALAGLLLDRSFGLLPHAPMFLLALAGLPKMFRRDLAPHLLVGAAVLAPVLAWRMWWGGQCPPGRLLVPLVGILAVALAMRCAASERGLVRWRWPLAVIGAALTLRMTADPGELLLLNRGERPTRLWAALSGETQVARYLPSLTGGDPAETRVAILWAVAILAVLFLDRAAQRSDRIDRLFRGLGLPVAVLLLLGVLVDVWARPGAAAGPGPVSSTAAAASG